MITPSRSDNETPAPRPEGAAQKALPVVMKEIEARFAASLLDAALPKSKGLFGKGVAGSMARESLVNRIAQVMAEQGALGLYKPLAKAGQPPAAAAVQAPAGTAARGSGA